MKNIKQKIEHILSQAFDLPVNFEDARLFTGKTGYLLFLSRYHAHKKTKETQSKLKEGFDQFLNNIPHCMGIDDSSLCSGYTGLLWTFKWMEELNLIRDPDKILFVGSLEAEIKRSIENDYLIREYDLLYGLMGKGVYLVKDREKNRVDIEKLVDHIAALAKSDPMGKYWVDYYSEERLRIPEVENYGLAHGIPGILIFLSNIHAHHPSDQLRGMISDSVERMLQKEITGKSWCFPETNITIDKRSRLGWCFGDLGVAQALVKTAGALQNREYKRIAEKIVLTSCARDIANSDIYYFKEESRYDIALCHGLAGVCLMYDIFSVEFDDQGIKDKYLYYLDILLDSTERLLESDRFQNNLVSSDLSFLNGLSGALLYLLYVLDKNYCSWKELLLLN